MTAPTPRPPRRIVVSQPPQAQPPEPIIPRWMELAEGVLLVLLVAVLAVLIVAELVR